MKSFLLAVVLMVLLAGCTVSGDVVSAPGGDIRVTVASTPDEQTIGLSGHDNLDAGAGMLFTPIPEGAEATYAIQTRTMTFPIDVVFLDVHGRVTAVYENAPPGSDELLWGNTAELGAVLELRAGDANAYGIEVGSALTIRRA